MTKKDRAAKAQKKHEGKKAKRGQVVSTVDVPFEAERKSLIECALSMRASALIKGDYDTMLPSDVVLVDKQGTTIDGKRRPTSDMTAVLYIFRNMPQVNVVIHTHQPYATALGLVVDELPADFTTVIDELHAAVHVAPFTRSSDEGMGILTVEHIGDALAVILKHHGVIAVGKSIDQALTAAVYLEESCQAYLAALATNLPITHLTPKQIADEAEERGYYGQPEA